MNRAPCSIWSVFLLVALAWQAVKAGDELPPEKAPARQLPKVKPRSDSRGDSAQPAPTPLVSGTVRDPAGRTVSAATVWLVTGEKDAFDPPVETLTDDRGQFTFAAVDDQRLTGTGRRTPQLIVRDKNGRLGWHQLYYSESQRWHCDIRLHDAANLPGRVLDAQGQPIAGAKLTCESFTALYLTEASSPASWAVLFPDLAAGYQAQTRDDGSFVLPQVPTGTRITCRLSAAGITDAQVAFEPGQPAMVRLGEPGSIAGKLVFPEGSERGEEPYQLQITSRQTDEKSDSAQLRYSRSLTADPSGRFLFDGLPPGQYVISGVNGQNVPWFAAATEPLEVKAGQRIGDLTIPLKKCQRVHGRVVDASTRKGVESVELTIVTPDNRDYREVVSDAEGRFAAWLRPGKVWVRAGKVPERFVEPPWENTAWRDLTDGEWPTIRLSPGATLRGRVIDDVGNPVPLAELDIDVEGVQGLQRASAGPPHRADLRGNFAVTRLDASSKVVLRARTADAASDAADPLNVSADDGPVTIVVSPKFVCRITGKVVDPRGMPVPEAKVSLLVRERVVSGRGTFGYRTTTVALLSPSREGTVESEALWGGDAYQLKIEADGYGPLETDIIATIPGKVYDFGAVTIEPKVFVQAQVVGDDGQAVPHADLVIRAGTSRQPRPFPSKTDAAGHFSFSAHSDDVFSIWARAGAAASNGASVIIASRLADKPVEIVVSERFVFRVSGKVVDRRGRPMNDAVATVVWIDDVERNAGRAVSVLHEGKLPATRDRVSEGPVGADGAFTTGALWPDLYYHLVVAADGCQIWESPLLFGEPGEKRDLRTIVLKRSELSVEGRVVDAMGQAVEGAAIINSGDAPQPMRVETGADGRFRLEGLPDGPVYLLVRKAGYWPSGARRQAGDSRFDVVLHDTASPREASGIRRANAVSAEELQLVREGLTKLWQLRHRFETAAGRRGRSSSSKARLIGCMASIDLDQALRWSAAEGGNYDYQARLAAAKRIVDHNVDDALLLADIPDESAPYALRAMALRRLSAGAKQDALRLLRAEVDPTKTRGRYRVVDYNAARQKAEVGRLAIKAGDYEWGRRLIDDAADEVENHAGDQESVWLYARAAVAEALAGVEPARAMRVWRTLPRQERSRGVVHQDHDSPIAAALAADDLPDARKILEAVEKEQRSTPGWGGLSDTTRAAMAHELARTSIAAALELLDEHTFARPGAKAEALSWMAITVAGRDKPHAWELIDRAFEACLDQTANRNGSFDVGRPFNAARIAIKAQKIDYPDMPSVVDRVLAARATSEDISSAAALAESTLNVASFLALIEPELARELLVSIEPQSALIGTGGDRTKRGDWLAAWALVDLDRAQKLFDDEFATQRKQPKPDLFDSGLLPTLELLATPPDERAGYLQRDVVYTFLLPMSD